MKFRFLLLVFFLSFFAIPLSSVLPSYSKETLTNVKKDQIVYVTRTGKKYHRLGCRYLRRSSIEIKLSEAKKSYDPCSVCKPPK